MSGALSRDAVSGMATVPVERGRRLLRVVGGTDAAPLPVGQAPALALQRTFGRIDIGLHRKDGATRLARFYQEGAGRARLPRVAAEADPEIVVMNTAGGLTGGDRFSVQLDLAADARAAAATQASEKIYRSAGGEARIENILRLGPGARLDWLPQETILFDRARLDRSLTVEMAEDATLLAAEAVVFGRTAMGETVSEGYVRDRWRVRRAGRLVFAEGTRVDGAIADALARKGTLSGARAMALVLYTAPDAEDRIDDVRRAFDEAPAEAGASVWDGLLAARIVAADGAALRATLIPALAALRDGRPLPKVWTC
jgi:urease accessory protein